MIFQKEISLTPLPRGFHLITDLVSEVIQSSGIQTGTAQVFLLHASASLSINENTDPSIRLDFESHINKLVPENQTYYQHNYEGSDDMPAHIKASLLSTSIHFPISFGRPRLGRWQGVYLGEHRNNGGVRKLVITVNGAWSCTMTRLIAIVIHSHHFALLRYVLLVGYVFSFDSLL